MRVLGVIPARGGSKGVPKKNITPLLGLPLLSYTARAALSAKRLTRVVLSTDDEEIAEVGKRYGLDVPFMRPAQLAQDMTPTLPVLQDVVRRLAAAGEDFDAVLTLQPTNPLRRASDIDGAVELLVASGADSVISFVDCGDKAPRSNEAYRLARPGVRSTVCGEHRGATSSESPETLLEGGFHLSDTHHCPYGAGLHQGERLSSLDHAAGTGLQHRHAL